MEATETKKMFTEKEIAELLDTVMVELIGSTNMRRCCDFRANQNCPNILESYIDMTGIVCIDMRDINKDQSAENVLRLLKSSMFEQLTEMVNILSKDLVTLTKEL